MKRKRNKIFLLSLLFFLGMAISSHAQKFKTHKDTKERFSVQVPEDWEILTNYTGTFFLAHRPAKYKGELKIENVALSKIDDTVAKSLDEAFSLSAFSTKTRDSTMLIGEEGKSEKSNYRWYVSTHRSKDGKETIKNITVVYFERKSVYILMCTTSVAMFNVYKDIFLKIAASLTFY